MSHVYSSASLVKRKKQTTVNRGFHWSIDVTNQSKTSERWRSLSTNGRDCNRVSEISLEQIGTTFTECSLAECVWIFQWSASKRVLNDNKNSSEREKCPTNDYLFRYIFDLFFIALNVSSRSNQLGYSNIVLYNMIVKKNYIRFMKTCSK